MTELAILTGYLGAGKTTTLQHLLAEMPKKTHTAVIINEYAAAGIDGKIVDDKRYTIKELENGCICCTRGRDLKAQIQNLTHAHNPDIILIETTGVAEPEPLLDIIKETNTPVRAIIVVLDAYQYSKTHTLGDVSKRQLRLANLVVINKQDLVSKDVIKELTQHVRAHNPQARVHTTTHGNLAPKTILNSKKPVLQHTKKARKIHRHDTKTLTLHTKRIVRLNALEELLANLPADVARAKGIVRTARGYKLFQYAAGLYTIEPAKPPKDKTGVFVFIGPLKTTTKLWLTKQHASLSHKTSVTELARNAKNLLSSLD